MARLRRLSAPLSALLAVLVVVQTTDLLVCPDEAAVAESVASRHAGTFAQGGHPSPAPGSTHPDGEHDHDGPAVPDCLCHVVFTPTAVIPSAEPERPTEPAEFAAYVAAPPEVEPMGLDHVPLA